jgi:hypothetical protein
MVRPLGDDDDDDDDPVTLRVEGREFLTSYQVLHRIPNTFFSTLRKGKDNVIDILGSKLHFTKILDFLASGTLQELTDTDTVVDIPRLELLFWLKKAFNMYSIVLPPDGIPTYAFALGGYSQNEPWQLNTVERLNISSNEWDSRVSMRCTREHFSACSVGNMIYVTGGQRALKTGEMYDSKDDTWTDLVPMRHGREHHTSVVVDKCIYVIGGSRGDRELQILSSVEKFDTDSKSWTDMASLPGSRCRGSACVFGTDIYYFGGLTEGQVSTSSVLKYDTIKDSWSDLKLKQMDIDMFPETFLWGTLSVQSIGDFMYLLQDDIDNRFVRFDPISLTFKNLPSCRNTGHNKGTMVSSFVVGKFYHAVFRGQRILAYDTSKSDEPWIVLPSPLSASRPQKLDFAVTTLLLDDPIDTRIKKAMASLLDYVAVIPSD